MRFRINIDGIELTSIGKIEGLEISRNTREAISTARVQFQQRLEAGDKFAARAWREWKVIEIYEDAAPLYFRYFGGYVAEMQRTAQDNEKFTVDIRAVDYGVLLDRKVSAQLFIDQTDRAIVHALIAEAGSGLSSNDDTVDNTTILDEFDARDMIIREALERLCERTGCRWGTDPGKNVWYYKLGLRFAPWNLSDTPDYLLSYPYQMRSFQRVFSNAANKILLLGGLGESGTELRVSDDEPASITEYGTLEAVRVDRTITSTAVATLTVQSDLAERAYPRISGRVVLRDPPVPFGQLQILGEMIGIKSALYDVDDNFQIYSERLSTEDGTPEIICELEFGVKENDFITMIRQLARKDPGLPEVETTLPPGTPIPAENIVGTIGVPGQSVTIAAENVTGTLSGEDVIVAAGSVQGTLTGDLVNVSADIIQGMIGGPGSEATIHAQAITTGVIGGPGSDVAIDATKITVGVIVGAQLTDQILDSLRLVGPGMGVVERIPSGVALPALPNLEYPAGSTVLQSAIYSVSVYGTARYGSTLYEARADNLWHVTSASASLTGILKAADIENINANQITGVIVASQIQSINAAQITGLIQANQIGQVNATSIVGGISADQIASVNASDIVGGIIASQITSVNASAITGGITASQITSVNASAITGGITASQITSVNASAITGGITASQISTVNASAITGGITASQITSVNASTITTGTMQGARIENIVAGTITIGTIIDSQIGNVSGSKLVVGTVDSDKLNATEIKVGGGGSKPGKLGVYNSGNSLVAQLGTLGGLDYGGWFLVFGAGGSGYSSAKVYTNISGNLFIRDADLEISHAGTGTKVQTSPTTFDSTYSSITLNVMDASSKAMHISRGFVVTYSGSNVATLNSKAGGSVGECVIYSGGGIVIHLDGSTGRCGASGFDIRGVGSGQTVNVGYTKAAGGTGTMFFTGGILTALT